MYRVGPWLRQSWDMLGLLALALTLLAATLPLSRVAAWIPRLVLAVTIVLIFVRLVVESRANDARPSTAAPAAAAEGETRPATPVIAALWNVGLLLAVMLFGATAGTALFCFVFLRARARESWLVSAVFAIALGAVVQLVFAMLLQADLYRGWLVGLW